MVSSFKKVYQIIWIRQISVPNQDRVIQEDVFPNIFNPNLCSAMVNTKHDTQQSVRNIMVDFYEDHCHKTVRSESMRKTSIPISCISTCACPLLDKRVNKKIPELIKLLMCDKTSII